jgi:hypothetical protein
MSYWEKVLKGIEKNTGLTIKQIKEASPEDLHKHFSSKKKFYFVCNKGVCLGSNFQLSLIPTITFKNYYIGESKLLCEHHHISIGFEFLMLWIEIGFEK